MPTLKEETQEQLQQILNSPSAPLLSNPAAKVGSSIATLWLKVNQDNQPPASIPSTLLPSESCPQCNHTLAPPLKSSGRQVCLQCGWTNKPRNSATLSTPGLAKDEPTETDSLSLLEKAASESLENMKLRQQSDSVNLEHL